MTVLQERWPGRDRGAEDKSVLIRGARRGLRLDTGNSPKLIPSTHSILPQLCSRGPQRKLESNQK